MWILSDGQVREKLPVHIVQRPVFLSSIGGVSLTTSLKNDIKWTLPLLWDSLQIECSGHFKNPNRTTWPYI